MSAGPQSTECRCQPHCGRQRVLWLECAVERDEDAAAKVLVYQQAVARRAVVRQTEQVGDVASWSMEPVMLMGLEASPASALAGRR